MTTPKNTTSKRSPSRHIENGPVNAERRFLEFWPLRKAGGRAEWMVG